MIQVDHLVKACEGDPELLSGLAVLLAMASYCLGGSQALKNPTPESVIEQMAIFTRAHEEIQRQLLRVIP